MAITKYLPTTEDTLSKLMELSAWLMQRGLRTEGGRLAMYIQQYKRFCEHPPTDDPKDRDYAIIYVQMVREVEELIWTCDAIRHSPPPGCDAILDRALGGSALTKDDTNKQNARDYLFNLRIAAYFARSGFQIAMDQVADVVAMKNGLTFFIECKRLKSEKKVHSRKREALQQLDKRLAPVKHLPGYYGVAAFDVSLVAMQPNVLPAGMSHDAAIDHAAKQFDAFVRRYNIDLYFCAGPRILATLQQIFTVYFCESRPIIIVTSHPSFFSFFSGPDALGIQLLSEAFQQT